MAYYAEKFSTETSNVLPGAQASVALAVGDTVYLDSNGKWAKAQSVAVGSTSRKDAQGVIIRTALANEFISPVKVAELSGYSGLTAGAKQYQSATAGTITETEPSTTVRQEVGVAVTTTKVRFEIGAAGGANQAGDVGGDAILDTLTIHCVTDDANDKHITFQKARDDAIVQSGDDIGSIDFNGYNGTSYDTAVQLLAEVAGTPGATTDMPGKLTIKCSADGSATPSDVVTFADGTITLADSVDIVVNTSTGTKIGTATTQKIGFYDATPIVQPGAYTQTYSTGDKTIANPTCVSMGDLVATNGGWGASSEANFDKITTAVDQIIADNLDLRQGLTSVIDDLQALGLFG